MLALAKELTCPQDLITREEIRAGEVELTHRLTTHRGVGRAKLLTICLSVLLCVVSVEVVARMLMIFATYGNRW